MISTITIAQRAVIKLANQPRQNKAVNWLRKYPLNMAMTLPALAVHTVYRSCVPGLTRAAHQAAENLSVGDALKVVDGKLQDQAGENLVEGYWRNRWVSRWLDARGKADLEITGQLADETGCVSPEKLTSAFRATTWTELRQDVTRRAFAVPMVVVAADQIIKLAVQAFIPESGSVSVIDGVLSLHNIRNTGAAFGQGAGEMASHQVATLITTLLAWGLYRSRKGGTGKLAAALWLSAGVAHGIERVLRGSVLDYIRVETGPLTFLQRIYENWPVFDLADVAWVSAIFVAMAAIARSRPPLSADSYYKTSQWQIFNDFFAGKTNAWKLLVSMVVKPLPKLGWTMIFSGFTAQMLYETFFALPGIPTPVGIPGYVFLAGIGLVLLNSAIRAVGWGVNKLGAWRAARQAAHSLSE